MTTIGLVIAGALVTSQMNSIAGAWKFLLALGAGTGAVYILRWYWWRINAWSEVSAMSASFVVSLFLQSFLGMDTKDPAIFAKVMLITVFISTIVWLAVTFLTKPENDKTLIEFYTKIKPGGMMWKPIEKLAPNVMQETGLGWNLLDWAAGIIMIYSALFGVGKIILGSLLIGIILLLIAGSALLFIWWDLNRRGWKTWSE